MRRVACLVVSILLAGSSLARAAECANPDALGTARVIAVDPREHARIGTMSYDESLPLAEKEVVLTFDDGPIAPYSQRVLDALAAECVQATFFVVGQMVRASPELVRRAHQAGHTIGTHTDSHPFRFDTAPAETIAREIDAGIAATAEVLGDRAAVAPFFRFPGFRRSVAGESELAKRGLMAWSADFPADDWMKISADAIIARALDRLDARRKGVLLLHDIQPATALALPRLLRELKARGYRVVHVVPVDGEHPTTATVATQWTGKRARARLASRLPIASPDSFGWPRPYRMSLPGETASAAEEPDANRPAWAGAELPDFEIANPEIAGRYGLTQTEEPQSRTVVARADEALGSMTRRPRPRVIARPQAEPREPPMLFGSLFRPFFSQTP